MGEEQELQKRREQFRKDRRSQAKWYESLNLYAEAMRIYRSIDDSDNIRRLEEKMREEYGENARKLEKMGKYQEAANLYYLIGDMKSVGRMKRSKPDLVIIYDEEEGGLAKLASGLDHFGPAPEESEDYFMKPNPADDFELDIDGEGKPAEETAGIKEARNGKAIPVKMPKNMKKMRFCPYCGERISTRKDPKFCPFCGDEL